MGHRKTETDLQQELADLEASLLALEQEEIDEQAQLKQAEDEVPYQQCSIHSVPNYLLVSGCRTRSNYTVRITIKRYPTCRPRRNYYHQQRHTLFESRRTTHQRNQAYTARMGIHAERRSCRRNKCHH